MLSCLIELSYLNQDLISAGNTKILYMILKPKFLVLSSLMWYHGRLVHVAETLTDLKILGCELHKNTFGGPQGEL